MRARRHVVLLAKAPRRGAVKRRLAAGIGDAAALAFYRATLRGVARRLGGDPRWTLWIAVTPERVDMHSWRFGLRRRPRLLKQGAGDLGHRMGRVLRTLPPGPVVIVGSDIPALDRRHIADAFAQIGGADLVFGPALDGGYWLIGARGAARHADLFRAVRWSTGHALEDTRANVPPGRRVALLAALQDIDDAAALAAWRASRG